MVAAIPCSAFTFIRNRRNHPHAVRAWTPAEWNGDLVNLLDAETHATP